MTKALVVGQSMTPEVMKILEDFSITHAQFLKAAEVPKSIPDLLSRSPKQIKLMILNRTHLEPRARKQCLSFAQKTGVDFLEFGPDQYETY